MYGKCVMKRSATEPLPAVEYVSPCELSQWKSMWASSLAFANTFRARCIVQRSTAVPSRYSPSILSTTTACQKDARNCQLWVSLPRRMRGQVLDALNPPVVHPGDWLKSDRLVHVARGERLVKAVGVVGVGSVGGLQQVFL